MQNLTLYIYLADARAKAGTGENQPINAKSAERQLTALKVS